MLHSFVNSVLIGTRKVKILARANTLETRLIHVFVVTMSVSLVVVLLPVVLT
jgi:hypothetical protein